MEKTTIQLDMNTLERLKGLKNYERQSYDELLNGIFNEIEKETITEEEINEIKLALEDIKRGRVFPIEAVAKELGITLK